MLIELALSVVLSSPARLQSTCTATSTGAALTGALPRSTTPGSLVVAGITHANDAHALRVTRIVDEAGLDLVEVANNADGGGSHDNRLFIGRGGGGRTVSVQTNVPVDGKAFLSLFLAEYENGTVVRVADRRGDDAVIVVGPVLLSAAEFAVGTAVVEMGSVVPIGRVDGGVEIVEKCSGDISFELLDAGSGTFASSLAASAAGWNSVWAVLREQPDAGADAGRLDAGTSIADGGMPARENYRVATCTTGFASPLLVGLLAWSLRAAARGAAGRRRGARRGPG